MGLFSSEDPHDRSLSHFDTTPHQRVTDRQTYGFTIAHTASC